VALSRVREALDGFDADDGRDCRDLEPMPRVAEIFLHGANIEASSDLLSRGDREAIAGGLDKAAALEFVLEEFAFRLCAFQGGVGVTERVREPFGGKIVEARCGREIRSLGHGHLRGVG
jgi:hypothetical protein